MERKRISSELLVGILVLVGIIMLFYMSFRIGRFGAFNHKGYELSAEIDNANGLDEKSPVHIAGVQVGRVKSIQLDGYKALLKIMIADHIRIPSDSTASVKTQGTLGDKYIEILPGKAQTYLASGDRISNVTVSPGLDDILAQVSTAAKGFGETMDSFKSIVGEEGKANIQKSLKNIEVVSGDFKDLIANNKANIGKIVTNFETISSDIENGKGTIGKLVKDETLYNDAKDVVASLRSVSQDLEQGKGTLGKLAKDDALYEQAKTAIGNITDITEGIKKGEGTLGRLAKDDSLIGEAEKTLKKVQKAAEGIQEQTPVTILSTIFGAFF
ncbi:MAG TPA: MlaD family protein [Syntrophorhabdaceae bacterium]|nr:MlaD family protein [Syntrophorhabdaceae bacterium]